MSRICIVTTTRAEYGLLIPLIKRVENDDEFEVDLIASGTHLSSKYGYTKDEIEKDGFKISHEIPILDRDNTSFGIAVTMSNAIKGFAECFKIDRPDIVVILGDRTEMLGVASAALVECIPIAHIHGGEITEGAVDDCIRNAITKMSQIHFTANETYRQRVIQMGESPDRVFNVGALGVENILSQELMTETEIRSELKIPALMKYAVVTYHPVTMENDTVTMQLDELCKAMDKTEEMFYLITGSNADSGGDKANELLREYVESHTNAVFVTNLGMKRYLSAVRYAAFVLGNSSSGIIEAPALGTPTVNIGDRQKGRLMADTVICCDPVEKMITDAIDKSMKMKHKSSSLYGDGNTSEKIVEIIKRSLKEGIEVKKHFYDIERR